MIAAIQKEMWVGFKCNGPVNFFSERRFLFSGHEPIYFTENKEKTLRVSYDRDTHTIEYMN